MPSDLVFQPGEKLFHRHSGASAQVFDPHGPKQESARCRAYDRETPIDLWESLRQPRMLLQDLEKKCLRIIAVLLHSITLSFSLLPPHYKRNYVRNQALTKQLREGGMKNAIRHVVLMKPRKKRICLFFRSFYLFILTPEYSVL